MNHHNLFLFIKHTLKLNKCLFVQFIQFEVVLRKIQSKAETRVTKIVTNRRINPFFIQKGVIRLMHFQRIYLGSKYKKEEEKIKDNKSLI